MTFADWHDDGLRAVGAFLHNQPGLLWWLNGSTEPVKVRLPASGRNYRVLADSATGQTWTDDVLESGDALLLEARAFLLLQVD